jgi:serine/threonine protein kinase/tetratricopeptide (TPR) repeat protein
MLGTTLAGRYKIESELGRGGMGTVYRGYDLRLDRPVAIKVVLNSGLGTEGRTRLLSEAQAAARLNHPNVVTVYDALESNETPFIVMELVEGKTLRSVQNPSLSQSIEFGRQICSALAHAHEKGIIHRDLKPENTILTPSGAVKLMDFGLARNSASPHITQSGVIMGTIAYMAPELIQGGEASPQSDLYALGVMLYEMTTRQTPFNGDDIYKIMGQHLHSQPIPPRQLSPEIPDPLETLILRLLHKKPADRPGSASEVEAILAMLQIHNDTTRPVIAPGRQTDEKKRAYAVPPIPVLEPGEKELILANRHKEIQWSIEYLKSHRVLMVTGMPGIGKSSLARTLLESRPPETPPPFWYDFERQQSSGNTLGTLLDRISRYLGSFLGPDVAEELLSFRNSPNGQASAHEVDILTDYLNHDKPIWMVFDNLEAVLTKGGNTFVDEGLEMLFSGLKNNSHNAKIIISSPFVPVLRSGGLLLEFGTKPLALQGLSPSASVKCLQAHGLLDTPEDVLLSLAKKVEGHPFALYHVARYVEALGAEGAFDIFPDGLDAVSGRFSASLQQRLSPEEFTALQATTVLKREISLEGLRKIAQTTPGVLKRLRDEGLLEANEAGKFWLPTIVQSTVRTEKPELLRQAHLRAMQYYRELGLPISRRSIDDYANVLEWHYHAVHAGEPASAYAALFSTGLANHLKQWNEFHLLAQLNEEIFSKLATEQTILPKKEQINLLRTLGMAYLYLREYPKSIEYIELGLNSLTEGEDPIQTARLQLNYAEALSEQNKLPLAMEMCQKAVKVYEEHPNDDWYANAMQLRGIIHRRQGKLEEAIQDLEMARTLFEKFHEKIGVAYVTGELAIVYFYQNQFENALENHQRTVQLCEERQDWRGAMFGHNNIGDIFLQQEQYGPAQEEFKKAFEIAHKKRLHQMEVLTGLCLAEAHIALGQFKDAEAALDILKPVIKQQANICMAGQELYIWASLYGKQGQINEAREYFKEAFELLRSEECQYEQARANLAYADFLKTRMDLDNAQKALQAAKAGFTSLNMELGLRAVEKAMQALNDLRA